MLPGTDQLRLLWAMALVVIPVVVGYRFARRLQSPLVAIKDAVLIAYLIQYISVGMAGMLGVLTPVSLTVISLLICGILWVTTGLISSTAEEPSPLMPHPRWVAGICLVTFGFAAAMIYSQRMQPPLATDALTYHLPAAVLWLQKKRIVLFQAWFFNPGNTYSPLSGSMFLTWLMAPIGNDALARFAQFGPWALILFAILNIARSGGAPSLAAALVGAAAVLSRPFISECILAKDDLFVAAFFLVAVASLSPEQISRKFGAARIGVSIGLLLAMKYTALLTLPMFLLAIDAPIRAKWRLRQWCVAAGCDLLIAGPWYLRNCVLFGNPLFPLKLDILGVRLPGLISSVHVRALRTPGGVWNVLTGGYFGLPPVLFCFLSVTWLVTVARFGKALVRDPVRRIIILGPPIGIATYVLFSPQPEIRFLFPAFGLMFAASALACAGSRSIALTAIGLTLAVCTSFVSSNADQIVTFLTSGIAIAIIGLSIWWLESDQLRFRRPILSLACVVAVFLFVCTRWSRYLEQYRDSRFASWQAVYPSQGLMWSFLDGHIPATATVAYSNQFMIYPMFGFEYQRRVIYAPVRAGASIANLKFSKHISDGDFGSSAAANASADPVAWKENLGAAGAEYLVVGMGREAPEIAWADADPAHFQKMFANEQAAVYRIQRPF